MIVLLNAATSVAGEILEVRLLLVRLRESTAIQPNWRAPAVLADENIATNAARAPSRGETKEMTPQASHFGLYARMACKPDSVRAANRPG